MKAIKYAYALLAAIVIGAGVFWALGLEPEKPQSDVLTKGAYRFGALAPASYDALSDCVVCHRAKPGGADRSAPSLVGIVGAPVARSDWFGYSPALREKGGRWSESALNDYLQDPNGYVPGTFKTLSPIRSAEQREEIIDALKKLDQ